ncbi:DNA topoisomerase IB [Mycolicibacter sinensis]|uniref:DNA topoisomerase n=1 Tax=Mycolicibacter sinensis (strain JDM601) TaxID=875328 RepID=A0A1A3U3S8_MYCSD|nr:DNA topoisomerase IB [Mycolicibacter sinensis]OBK89539.1 DNA topoisomerase [Mycolicibacter sinensis]
MRLRRSNIGASGFRRIGRGRGFSYTDGQRPVDDPEVLARIKELAIPPAWRNVWICPYPNGHVQAVGTDAAGRRQYLYHQQWQDERAEEKYDRVLTLAKMLPQWRADVLVDLRGRGLKRDRVLAVAQQLIDRGYFRAGGEEYAQENGSFGLATLLRDHVRIRSDCVDFDYPAKSGVRRTVSVDDPLVVRAVRSLLRAPTDIPRLLVYRTPEGWCEVRADDLNERFRELTGEQFSVKDLRTWHGTVLAAESFAAAREPTSKTVRRREIAAVMRAVSEELGNTPAVARSSYVDPRVVEAYEQGVTIRAALNRAKKHAKTAGLVAEEATARLIRRIDRARR